MYSTICFTGFYIFLLARPSSSHFILSYPASLGFDANNENVSPCGGFPISFSSATNYHVGGDSIALTTLHPQSNFLFRGTLDPTASGNWSNFLPVVGEYGLGAFCEAIVAVPASWVGSQGVIQVVQNAEDGVHYQCAAVNFVAGLIASTPSACTNTTGISASFTSDVVLVPGAASSSSTFSGTTTGTATSSSTKATTATLASPTSKSSSKSLSSDIASNGLWWMGGFVVYLLP